MKKLVLLLSILSFGFAQMNTSMDSFAGDARSQAMSYSDWFHAGPEAINQQAGLLAGQKSALQFSTGSPVLRTSDSSWSDIRSFYLAYVPSFTWKDYSFGVQHLWLSSPSIQAYNSLGDSTSEVKTYQSLTSLALAKAYGPYALALVQHTRIQKFGNELRLYSASFTANASYMALNKYRSSLSINEIPFMGESLNNDWAQFLELELQQSFWVNPYWSLHNKLNYSQNQSLVYSLSMEVQLFNHLILGSAFENNSQQSLGAIVNGINTFLSYRKQDYELSLASKQRLSTFNSLVFSMSKSLD